jgi:hypothetical protein
MTHHPFIIAVLLLTFAAMAVLLLPGCAVNGRPMRFAPDGDGATVPKSLSWYIEGTAKNEAPISCSFVEFDERGDFLDFRQHLSCESTLKQLVKSGKVLTVLYCHGWKNNSQSGDVTAFNSFLAKLATSPEIGSNGFRVHGVYLAWRGNSVRPYVDKVVPEGPYAETAKIYGKPIVDGKYERRARWTGFIPENVSYFTRKRAAEHLVSGLPMARAIFTYASTVKDYGRKLDNRVCVIGHSFGALMLERSLGQAMSGALVMEWWEGETKEKALPKPGLPFDLILFVNSAAPSIYAKEMRDFLEAHRKALHNRPGDDAPVIVSLTSTADSATGSLHPLANMLAPIAPSLKRRYTTGIFGQKQPDGTWPTHEGIRQSEFYTKTPGHQPYLVNHWIIKEPSVVPLANSSTDKVFADNIAQKPHQDPDVFFTSKAKYPAAAWRITPNSPDEPVTLDGLTPSMSDSDYWIISCGKELIGNHNDVWSTTTMEMYAGIYRAVQSRLRTHP